jgi:hypothetical protein
LGEFCPLIYSELAVILLSSSFWVARIKLNISALVQELVPPETDKADIEADDDDDDNKLCTMTTDGTNVKRRNQDNIMVFMIIVQSSTS